MAKKFLPLLLLSAFSCENKQKAYPAPNEDAPNFEADPNNFNYFENHFDELRTFLSNSLTKRDDITYKQIKKCIQYVVRFDDIKNFYNAAHETQNYRKAVDDLIFILASHYGKTLDKEILKYKSDHNGKCPMEELVNEVYKKRITEIKVFKEENIKGKKYHHSQICNKMKKTLSKMLDHLMTQRADIAFLVAMDIINDKKLSQFLNDPLCELLDDDSDDNVDVLKKIFLDELELNNITYFSPDACKNAHKSQRELFYKYFESSFQKEYPEISFQNEIKPYLVVNENNYVVGNLKEGVKDFFKTHYQKYPIHFSKFTLSFLTQYLEHINAGDKKDVCELLVLYLLNFYSTKQHFETYVFSDMGHTMLRYNSFKNEDAQTFNNKIDEIIKFIKTNAPSLNKELFSEVTGKSIGNGEQKIVNELLEQLNKGKRI